MMRGWHRNVRTIIGDGDPVIRRVAQWIGLATCAVPRWCCHKLNGRPYLSSEGGMMLNRLEVGTGAPARGSIEKCEELSQNRIGTPYLIGGGGGGGGRDEGREPFPGVGERSRIFEGCSESMISSSEAESPV